MQRSLITRAFLLMFSGPIIWAAHFLLIYVYAALACARGFADADWIGFNVVRLGITLLTAAALIAIPAICLAGWRNSPVQESTVFARWTTAALGGLSAVAIVWEAIPAFIVPVCW